MRLDQHLAKQHPDISRATWQKYINSSYVTVNDITETSTKRIIAESDIVMIDIPESPDFSESSLPIVYEDENIIVINKPAGVLTHSKGALNDEFTVAEFVRPKTSYKSDTNRPGIIHRLDRDTSGVILCVKNDMTAHLLQKQFQDRKTKKTYFAVVDGVPKEHEATIDLPIGRNPSKPSSFRVDVNGKSALTHYSIEKTDGRLSLIKLEPHTGRTHQLRVHMAYLNTPIHGDKVYGNPADRLYLHANKLEITIPTSNRMVFEVPVPPAFAKMIAV